MVETRLAEPRFRTTVAPGANTPASLGVDDVYYTLFRHKWKIVICSILGGAAAAGFYFTQKPNYESSAKLFVRYVVTEGRVARPSGDTVETKSPDSRGETIIQAELEILKSLDLATKVAQAVGPEKILFQLGGGNEVTGASVAVQNRLTVAAPRGSSVIAVSFKHPDPEVAQSVVRQVIDLYLKTHVEIHRSAGMVGEFLAQETDQLRSRLAQTEDELRKARAKAGVVSVEDAKKAFMDQIAGLRQQVFAAQAERAAKEAVLKDLTERLKNRVKTPETSPIQESPPPETTEQQLPPGVLEDLRTVVTQLESMRRRQQELLLTFTPEHPRVQAITSQVTELENRKNAIIAAHPVLTQAAVTPTATPTNNPRAVSLERLEALESEAAQLSALDARMKTLNAQIETLRNEAIVLDQLEGNIQQLLRKRELEEANYRRYAASLEQSRINEALGSGKVSNISLIQNPSPAFLDPRKTVQIAGGIVAGGIGLGLAWAFLIELLLDRSVRRPTDLERNVRAPLFLSIPKQRAPRRKRVKAGKSADDAEAGKGLDLVVNGRNGDPVAEALAPYYETLRDRLIGYFESINLTHKPKLVGLTSVGPDSGVTTMAAGLARTLSETGDGNVLLVDLTPGQGSSQLFHRGKSGCGLEELLETRSESAQVQDRLFVVSEDSRGDKLSRILPQRFAKLVPQLKTGDFDYIIFDMPPVSQISITPRLAGYMDMVLLVVESEKNSRDNVQQANELLVKSNATVGTVLNKTTNYIPRWIQQELPA
mgnify:CR=1 FL=1